MPRTTTLLAVLLSSLLAGTALAQPGPGPLAPPSGPVDPYAAPADGGGRVDRRADRQRPDRRVDRQRGRAGAPRQVAGRRLPPALRARLIARFDRDGDGRLTGAERRAAKRFVRQLRQLRGRGGGRGGAGGAGGAGGGFGGGGFGGGGFGGGGGGR